MSLLCKIIGHKPDTSDHGLPIMKPTGWVLEWNTNYNRVEFGIYCPRCSKLYPIGIYSEPKEESNEHG